MSDISKITTPDGTIYDIKDAAARTALGGHTVGANVPADAAFSDTTYAISLSNNVITLTGSSGDPSTVTLPDDKGVGEDVSGQTFTVDETEVTASDGAERFNDYTDNIATGNYSHAEGYQTQATGNRAHAEGFQSVASGVSSHAEGSHTTVSGLGSHAEGAYTDVKGLYSHAEGFHTIARGTYQHVQGKYNTEDTSGTYAHIVGNGNSSTRANIHTLDWNGAAWYKGGVRVGGTSAADATELTPGIEKFTITATIDPNTEPISCTIDKTYAEVVAAYNNGDILEVIDTDGNIFPLASTYENSISDDLELSFAITLARDVVSYGANEVSSYGFNISPSGVSIEDIVLSIPSHTSELTNDSGFITSYTETDPTVPSWAKQPTKPTYTASEVGALPSSTAIPSKTSDLTNDSGFLTSHQPVVQTLTSGTAIGSVGGTVLYAPSGGGSSSPEIYIGSTTPSGYTMWVDPEGMITDGNEVGY